VIGVIDIESPQPNHFTEEHKQILTLIASRVAVHIEMPGSIRAPAARRRLCCC